MPEAAPAVLILMGSVSDLTKVEPAQQTLQELGLWCEMHVASAHRTPERVAQLAKEARGRGVKVIIAAAGGAAHLAGAMAANTTLPVIGIPISSGALNGLDALLATVQMPSGMPVATVAIDGARNAALLAAQIIAVTDEGVATKLAELRAAAAKAIDDLDVEAELRAQLEKQRQGEGR
jgi:5-(carboxyamino)imidazole ribonucleotide mutase